MALPDAHGAIGFGGGIRGLGSVQLVVIERVQVGDAAVGGLRGCAVDLAPLEKAGLEIRGLLGLNFLRAYRVTLDFGARSLRLEPLPSN